jgi:hypothetical protein
MYEVTVAEADVAKKADETPANIANFRKTARAWNTLQLLERTQIENVTASPELAPMANGSARHKRTRQFP